MTQRARLSLDRAAIIPYRQAVQGLGERAPRTAASLQRAAWAGLQDSMPRAALLSLHARLEGVGPGTWEDPALIQLWGPRFSAYVIAAQDRAVFSLGRLPEAPARRRRAEETAARVAAFLDGRSMDYAEAGHAMEVPPNSLRYAAPTGTVLLRWDGARRPTIRTVPPPELEPAEARLELARRYLHVFGPSRPEAFAIWAGVQPAHAQGTFRSLAASLTPVRTPIGDAWILASDEAAIRDPHHPAAERAPAARLLPSGDTAFLLQGAERELLVPEPHHRRALWPSRVWPGALLLGGEIIGTWRRAGKMIGIDAWRPLARPEREALLAEAEALPLPGHEGQTTVRFEG